MQARTLTQTEIQALARSAGFSATAAPIASAIAMAESGGYTAAHNPKPPDDSYGLWQINMLGKLGPERRRFFGLQSNSDLFDPATNARAAYAISSQGRSFTPWTTYTHGTYRKYLTQGQVAAGQKKPASDGGTGPGPGGDIEEAPLPVGESRLASVSPLLIVAALLVAGFMFMK